jgi:hypothetical protein
MEINWIEIELKTAEEIENIIVELTKEIQIMRANKQIVKDEYNEVKKQIILLEGKRHDLKTSLDKQSNNIAQKYSDVEMLNTKKWQKKSGY